MKNLASASLHALLLSSVSILPQVAFAAPKPSATIEAETKEAPDKKAKGKGSDKPYDGKTISEAGEPRYERTAITVRPSLDNAANIGTISVTLDAKGDVTGKQEGYVGYDVHALGTGLEAHRNTLTAGNAGLVDVSVHAAGEASMPADGVDADGLQESGVEAAATGGRAAPGGNTQLWNTGTIEVDAAADLSLSGVRPWVVGDGSDMSIIATASITGLDRSAADKSGPTGLTGLDDRTVNQGRISGTADASAMAVEFDLVAAGKAKFDLVANSVALGIVGAETISNTITNEGTIDLTSRARSDRAQTSVQIVNQAATQTDVIARSTSAGIVGGSLDDSVSNTGEIRLLSDAQAKRVGTSFSLIDWDGVRSMLIANADTIGMDGGAGADTLTNAGTITARAKVRAEDTEWGGTALDVAGVEMGSALGARSTGIAGGAGGDVITNSGTIGSHAESDWVMTKVQISFADGSLISSIINRVREEEDDSASPPPAPPADQASAFGITGGAGNDTITNLLGGSIDLTANADVVSTEVSLGYSGVTGGVTNFDQAGLEGRTLFDLSNHAQSYAAGIGGESGDDRITNAETI